MNRLHGPTGRTARALLGGAGIAAALAIATIAIAALESLAGFPNASPVYLVAVVVCGLFTGTPGAIAASVGSFLVYNYLFTEPRFTFAIQDPGVLLSVVLLLFVGVVVGQLVAVQRARSLAVEAREREARAMFGVSRVLATRASTEAALAQIAAVLRDETGMSRVWVALGAEASGERVTADTAAGSPPATPARLRVLQRTAGDEPARWTLVHRPGGGPRGASATDTYRVRIEASGEPLGSVWAERRRDAGEPDRVQTRLLAAAADQIGQALARDRVAEQAQAAEIARRSDSLKSSLLQSVSHDFRTPLAVIRAAAGSLDSDSELSREDRRANTTAIEREVEYLDRLVANLLDLSRIEAGALRADRDTYDVDDLVSRAADRVRHRLDGRTLEVDLDPLLVRVDPVFVDAALANVVDNALKYTAPGARIRVTATADGPMVALTVEDDGAGVPDAALPRLFDKFYRVPGSRGGSRSGLGVGLAVVRGLLEATGGRVKAGRATLGGLAIRMELPTAELPAAEPASAENAP
ncbi:MAG TPA: ATP-binding protein [Candidatus Limnocylindrales bacterium]|nr:ATP-binding protein [Candidatus Limnocylindrales bacterium]